MERIFLDDDEVILLEESEVSYSGSVKDLDYIDEITLTNKRIICQWEDENGEESFEIYPNEIKKYNGKLKIEGAEEVISKY